MVLVAIGAILWSLSVGTASAQVKMQDGSFIWTGVVVDDGGEPVPGCAVFPKDNISVGVETNENGEFRFMSYSEVAEFTFSALGYVTRTIPSGRVSRVVLQTDAQTIQETVVTGIFTRKKDSFTGAVQTITSEDIKRVSNSNVVQALKNLDPSLLVLENLAEGSNPNAMASMQLRGASTFDMGSTGLKSNFLNEANTPLFILDGFETSLEHITDMDMNRIQSITILKDASAKAIYGSKGANGVIVIETKALTGSRNMVTYNGNVTLEMPDLTSYNLCNALEKLAVEDRYNYYVNGTDIDGQIEFTRLYNSRLKKALEGEDIYWLSKPLRTGVGQKHSIEVELGTKELKVLGNFTYNDVEGAMKGSDRKTYSGSINASYRKGKWLFRDIMSITGMNSQDSPWGNFDDYAKMNPYDNPYDENGNLVKNIRALGSTRANPMYNAFIGTSFTDHYLDFVNNTDVEFQVIPSLKLVGRFGIEKKTTGSDTFKPSDHTDFRDLMSSNDINNWLLAGSYEATYGNYISYNGDFNAQFNAQFADKHDVFATAQFAVSHVNYDEVKYAAVGFPSTNLTTIYSARQYALGSTPSGVDGVNRNLSYLLTSGYSYDSRYMVDATIKLTGGSTFGTDHRWGTFWSTGVAWNINNEAFLKDLSWLRQLKLRFSVGTSGNQNFATNYVLPVYKYNNSISSVSTAGVVTSGGYYHGFAGALLNNMENTTMGWEQKLDWNLGLDFRGGPVTATIDAYIADTKDMVFQRSILPSTGFSTVYDNLGSVRNSGIEGSLSWTVYQSGASYVSVFGKVAFNKNTLMKISDTLRNYNEQQQQAAIENGTTAPVIQYYDGMPLHSIWAVPSLGVDPTAHYATGYAKEIFIDRNGNMTDVWNAADLVNCGSSDPLFNGNFGINGEVKGIGFNVLFSFHGGGYLYNTTLVNKIENVNLANNVDRRIFSGRWYEDGMVVPYRDGYTYPTFATSRFVQKNNVLNLASVSLYYEVPQKLLAKLPFQRLRVSAYMNDLYTFSSIEIERGTSYPYARSLSFSLTASF